MPEYFTFFDRDMGMFSGKAARDYFATLIRNRLVEKLGQAEADKYPDLTFGQFHDIKADLGAMDLLVCGANLSIGRSVLFSWRHTPDFPVADAVRISMSLPGIYKPYLVTEQRTGWPPCGTYVDGGLWNNLPFREIGALAAEAPQAPPAAGGGQGTGQGAGQEVPRDIQAELRSLNAALNERATLGLRLEIVPPETVFTGQDVLFKSFMVAGETRLLPDIEPFTLILDTRRLSLLQFNPPPDVSAVVTRRSRRAMLSYFGETSEMIPSDAADERESEALRATSLCTGPSGETFLRPPDYSNRASPPLQGGRFTGF